MKSNRLFGCERWLFHRPAIAVKVTDGLGLHIHQVGRQHERVLVEWVMEDVDGEGRGRGRGWSAAQHQIMPGTHPDLAPIVVEPARTVGHRRQVGGLARCAERAAPWRRSVSATLSPCRPAADCAAPCSWWPGGRHTAARGQPATQQCQTQYPRPQSDIHDLSNRLLQQLRPKRNFARCGLTAHKPRQQRIPLAIHLARHDDHGNRHRRQRFPGQTMIVFADPPRKRGRQNPVMSTPTA